MRLIDADALQYSDARDMLPTGQYITREEINQARTCGAVEENNVALKKELDYWYKLAQSYEGTILKLCIALTKERDK